MQYKSHGEAPRPPSPGGSCLHEAHKEMLRMPAIGVSMSTVVGATLVYSLTGALGIDETLSGPVRRLLFGGMCAVVCWPVFHSTIATVLYLMRRLQPYLILATWAASILYIAMPGAAIGYAVIGLFGLSDVPFLRVYLHFGVGLTACSAILMYTACLRARLRHTAEAVLPEDRIIPEDSAPEDDRPPGKPVAVTAADAESHRDGDTGAEWSQGQPTRFMNRLPDKLGRDVIYLNVSGHYVNAVTTEGAGVILMRFADAVADLGDTGMQVHRSYWVAHRHITGVFRRDERTLIRVTGGHELPVSRTHLAAVRALAQR